MAKMTVRLDENSEPSLTAAAEVFIHGGVVIFPTETVYGIGVIAGHAAALEKLRRLKGRETDKPFQILVPDVDMAGQLGAVFSPRAANLARNFWPGPLTLVVPDKNGTSRLGIRIPDSTFIASVCGLLGRPIIASSANPAGGEPPLDARAADVFGDDVDLLVNGGRVTGGVASTVVLCEADNYTLLREGGISAQAIDAAWNE